MDKMNGYFVLGLAYVAFCVGVAVGFVWKTSQPETFTWWFPLQIWLSLFLPFLLGYLAGDGGHRDILSFA